MMIQQKNRILILVALTSLTLLIHSYDLLLQPIFGHSHFMHVVHARLCYIPIVLAAFWFGLRGGLLTALVISVFSFVYIILLKIKDPHDLLNEYLEIVFYFAIAGVSGFLLDRDKRIRSRQQEAEQKLQQTERLSMMGRMAASIAHEIKNPLGSIKGAAEIIADKSTSEKDREEFAGIIQRESDRLDKVVRDFLAYSRPSSPKSAKLDLAEILNTSVKNLKFEAEKRGVELSYRYDGPLFINGDAERLHQLFLNIILNAIQAMTDSGYIHITSERLSSEEDKKVRVKITDNGPGIPPEILPKIFDPFFSTKSQGTGLGLATAKSIVSEHDGTIEVEGKEGQGTTFIMTFPSVEGVA